MHIVSLAMRAVPAAGARKMVGQTVDEVAEGFVVRSRPFNFMPCHSIVDSMPMFD